MTEKGIDRRPLDLDASLVARIRARDPEAAVLLEKLYRQPMTRYCRSYLGDDEEARDAVQEIFGKVLKAAQVPDPDYFRPWLYRVARNHCNNVIRDRRRRTDGHALPPDSELDAESTGILTRLVKQEEKSRIMHAVAALPDKLREPLLLRYIAELPRAEIAYVLDIPESVIKSRLLEGLKKLR